jgi:hypothetical protein
VSTTEELIAKCVDDCSSEIFTAVEGYSAAEASLGTAEENLVKEVESALKRHMTALASEISNPL